MDIIDQTAKDSASKINNLDLKNRYKNPYLPLKVVEDFFKDPILWESFAKTLHYEKATDVLYPGERTIGLSEIDYELFVSFAERLLEFLPQYKGFEYLKASFHRVDHTYDKGWIHDDDPDITVSGLIYLNRNAPIGSGTVFYEDRIDTQADEYVDVIKKDILGSTAEERLANTHLRDKQRANFIEDITVENVFNRCIIFDPRVWHSPNRFFGQGTDSRLTLVFYARI